MPRPTLPKILLASALTLAIHSTLHAATDIESGTPGTGQDASASVTSSDPTNTITATGGSGAPNSNGGNATASSTLTPTTDSNSTLTATAGNGGDSSTGAPAGNGGNATISPITLSTTTSNITLTAIATGGNGGNKSTGNTGAGTGGSATLNPISLSSLSGNITANITQTSGNGGTIPASLPGIAPDSSLTNILSASTTGNITLTQTAVGGNASSSLTLTNTSAASLTANVKATAGSSGSATAYINLTGNNITATATAKSNATAIINSTSNASALATATNGNASATAFSSNPFFQTYRLYALGNAIPGNQIVGASLGNGTIPFSSNTSFAEQGFTNFAINETTNTTPINDNILHFVLFGKNSNIASSQTHTVGFEGTFDTSLFKPEDIVFKGTQFNLFPDFDAIRLRIWINGDSEIDQTMAGPTAVGQFFLDSSNHFRLYDLGSMSSFGTSTLDIQVQMDITTHATNQNGSLDLFLYNEDPALLTPEPASLSLLTAASLPLLLKRRRKN